MYTTPLHASVIVQATLIAELRGTCIDIGLKEEGTGLCRACTCVLQFLIMWSCNGVTGDWTMRRCCVLRIHLVMNAARACSGGCDLQWCLLSTGLATLLCMAECGCVMPTARAGAAACFECSYLHFEDIWR